MNKHAYLSPVITPVVAQFVGWLGANLDNNTLSHCYTNRRTGVRWNCTSLYDAYAQYHWPHQPLPRLSRLAGGSFAHNAATLSALRSDLQRALSPPLNDTAACLGAIEVMTWGGVRAGNVRWLNANTGGLASLLIDTRDALNANDTSDHRLTNPGLRFNSGMTKVYSLICDSLIIYDSRVAAALGWIVTKFCQAMGLSQVPAELCFPWAPAKEAPGTPSPKQRNPSVRNLTFSSLRADASHAKWNMKASWLLEAVLASHYARHSRFTSIPQNERLRAIEAALFMIGYDLAYPTATPPTPPPAPTNSGPPTTRSTKSGTSAAVTDDSSGYDCYTLSKGKPFRYRIFCQGIDIGMDKTIPVQDINATLSRLKRHFDTDPFPLANSVTGVPKGKAPEGLGVAYFQCTGKSAKHTSRLAAVLEELAIINPCNPAPARGLHWKLNTRLLGLDEQSTQVDISPILKAFLDLEDED
ncbi:hypothetical protein [Pseudomonas tohonis]|uniref:Uncharacterized protein n=1 Tax=Pseudomonas tohonis TaxID=2725477 RepID=A0ABQ4W6J7_9PSED|nr:hypothetical protein [Pseudomonas tohonis]GJN55073.1 hypothetical protein TUM20286_48250 [Pseudomonas tohonis]